MKLILILTMIFSTMSYASELQLDSNYTCEADDLQTHAIENNVTKGYSLSIYYNDNGGSFASVYQGPISPSGPILFIANLALIKSQSMLSETYAKQATRTPLEFTRTSNMGLLNFGYPSGTRTYLCILK